MICKYCGQFVDDDKHFCTNCGAAVTDTVQQPAPQPAPVFRPITPSAPVKKKGISKTKTVFFWASKAAVVIALILFFLPFMKISIDSGGLLDDFAKPVEMSGRELIFGLDDTDSNGGNDLKSSVVMIAGITAVISLIMTSGSAWLSGISSLMLFYFMRTADKSYTLYDKPIRDYDGIVKLEFGPAFYVCMVLLIAATVLAGIDQYKRRQSYESESPSSYGYI